MKAFAPATKQYELTHFAHIPNAAAVVVAAALLVCLLYILLLLQGISVAA